MNPLKEKLNALREEIKATAAKVKESKSDFSNPPDTDRGEIIANIMLSYRHLEDSAMRLGKAIQALEGGVSCYDRTDGAAGKL